MNKFPRAVQALKEEISTVDDELAVISKEIKRLEEETKKELKRLEEDRSKKLAERQNIARAITLISGDHIAELPLNAYAKSGNGNLNGHGNFPGGKKYTTCFPQKGTKIYSVYETLKEIGPVTNVELAGFMDMRKDLMGQHLQDLRRRGLAESTDGKWKLKEEAKEEKNEHTEEKV